MGGRHYLLIKITLPEGHFSADLKQIIRLIS